MIREAFLLISIEHKIFKYELINRHSFDKAL